MLQSKFYKKLDPILDGYARPLWSVMIPTYNCADYTRETLLSVLQQDPGPQQMQIAVIDDASRDNIEQVVKEVGRGRIDFFRQNKNVGHTRNFETALSKSRGHLIHLLHGDDRVIYGFYKEMELLLFNNPAAGAGFCRHYFIDEQGDQNYISPLLQRQSGIINNFLDQEARYNLIQTPSMVVRREVYQEIGMFDSRLKHSEDWEMWVRIATRYPVAYCKIPLAEYRNYNLSNTMHTASRSDLLEIEELVHDIIKKHAAGLVKNIEKNHKANVASNGWYNIRKLYELSQRNIAHQLLLKMLKADLTLTQKLKLIKIAWKMELNYRLKKARK